MFTKERVLSASIGFIAGACATIGTCLVVTQVAKSRANKEPATPAGDAQPEHMAST